MRSSAVSCCPSVAKLQESQAVKHGAKHLKHQFNWLPVLSATAACFIGNHMRENANIQFQMRKILTKKKKSWLPASGSSATVI